MPNIFLSILQACKELEKQEWETTNLDDLDEESQSRILVDFVNTKKTHSKQCFRFDSDLEKHTSPADRIQNILKYNEINIGEKSMSFKDCSAVCEILHAALESIYPIDLNSEYQEFFILHSYGEMGVITVTVLDYKKFDFNQLKQEINNLRLFSQKGWKLIDDYYMFKESVDSDFSLIEVVLDINKISKNFFSDRLINIIVKDGYKYLSVHQSIAEKILGKDALGLVLKEIKPQQSHNR